MLLSKFVATNSQVASSIVNRQFPCAIFLAFGDDPWFFGIHLGKLQLDQARRHGKLPLYPWASIWIRCLRIQTYSRSIDATSHVDCKVHLRLFAPNAKKTTCCECTRNETCSEHHLFGLREDGSLRGHAAHVTMIISVPCNAKMHVTECSGLKVARHSVRSPFHVARLPFWKEGCNHLCLFFQMTCLYRFGITKKVCKRSLQGPKKAL